MKLKSKLFAGVVAFTMVASAVAMPAGAQTTAELTAQINSLLAMIAQLQAQVAGGSTSTSMSMTFTSNLTVGSKGTEVEALQKWLVSKGYLTMPAGVAYGYFGPATKAALAKYQAEAGISPASGYFGPITRAKLNAMGGSTTTTTGGTTTTTGGSITTVGAEGTLAITQSNSGLVSTAYEGDSMVGILGFDAEAKNSDIAIQRIKIALGNSTTIYNKIYKKLYVTSGSDTLASVNLDSSTVIKDSGTYYVTISGFNLVVPKGAKKNIMIKADVFSSVDSADQTSYTVTLATDGVRGVDGAGIDQYAGGTSISRSTTIDDTLADSATLKVSLNTSSPKKMDVVASSGSNENELDKLTVLTFDLKAEKDAVTITDAVIGVAKTGAGAANASTTVYLFEGSTELDNASVSAAGYANFSDFDYTVAKDTTKTLTVKVDIRDANATLANFVATASSTGMIAENTTGDSLSASEKTGTATGYQIGVRNVGPEVTLVSKTVVTAGVAQTNGNPVSTSTLTATFNVKVKALGADLMFGTAASGTPMFASSTASFKVYRNGAYDGSISAAATSTSFTTPSGVTTAGLTNSFTLSEGNEVTIPVTFQIIGRNAAGTALTTGLYSVGFEGLNYTANGVASTVNFMAGEADWRTSDISFP